MNPYDEEDGIEEIYNELIDKSNQISLKVGTEPHKLLPMVNGYAKNELMITAFRNFFRLMKEKNLISNNLIFFVTDRNGKALDVESNMEIPQFLQRNQTGEYSFNIKQMGINPYGLSVTTKANIETHGKGLSYKDYLIFSLPIFNNNDELTSILNILILEKDVDDIFLRLIPFYELLFSEILQEEVIIRDRKDKEFLYVLTKNLYSTYDTGELLSEALKYINYFYPEDRFELWLSQDYKFPNEAIKLMNKIPNSEDIRDKAFIEGRLTINIDNNELAIPIRGRQGIYGVVYLSGKNSIQNIFKTNLLIDIVEIIGNAIENSQLYQQSANWIKRLELINSLTKMINNNLYKEEVIGVAINGLNKIYKNHLILFAEVDQDGKYFIELKSNQEQTIEKIPIEGTHLGISYKRKEAIIIADSKSDYGLEVVYCPINDYNSFILTPIFSEGEVIGILAVCAKESNHFSYDDLKFLQLLSQQFNLSLTNSIVLNKIQQLAITDYLTGLFNRSYLDDRIKESQQADKGGTLLLFDLDNFKDINDTYGHHIGDKILVQVADIFKKSIRDVDVAARWGGEELAVYLPKEDAKVASIIGDRIVKRVREETDPRITISCGVATWSLEDKDIDYLLLVHKADQALYEAKKNGKDQLIIYKNNNNDEKRSY